MIQSNNTGVLLKSLYRVKVHRNGDFVLFKAWPVDSFKVARMVNLYSD